MFTFWQMLLSKVIKAVLPDDTLTQSRLELQTLQLEDHPLYLLNPWQPLFNECSSKASQYDFYDFRQYILKHTVRKYSDPFI